MKERLYPQHGEVILLKVNPNKLFSALFLIASGLIYTTERVAARLAAAITDHDDRIGYPDFFDNFYVWFFFVIGLVFLILPERKNDGLVK